MSVYTWNRIRSSNTFYIRTYRKVGSLLLVSMALSMVLIYAIYYVWMHRTKPDYYATSGYYPPIQLAPLDLPNNTSTPLLPPDPDDEDLTRAIPQ